MVGVALLVMAAVRCYTTAVVRQYAPSATFAERVDLNEADENVLCELPGVGPSLAKRIVAARSDGGPFSDSDDLCSRVPGMGPERVAVLMRFASLDDESGP